MQHASAMRVYPMCMRTIQCGTCKFVSELRLGRLNRLDRLDRLGRLGRPDRHFF